MREVDHGSVGGVRVRGEFSSPSLAPVFVGAMELDRMVIGGDWEGIVIAAAQFEDGTTPQDDDTTGSEDAIATGSRKREGESLRERHGDGPDGDRRGPGGDRSGRGAV